MVVAERNLESRAEFAQLFFVELLLLVRDVLAFARFAEAIAFDGVRENDRGPALVLDRGFVGRVNLARIVAAAAAAGGAARRVRGSTSFSSCGSLPKKCCADVAPEETTSFWYSPSTISPMRLTSRPSVSRSRMASHSVPQITLMTFQPRAAECGFEFLNDLAVAAHRTVETLQVAVDDENQVVEFLARGEGDRAERFRLIRFAVAEERPDLGVRDAA